MTPVAALGEIEVVVTAAGPGACVVAVDGEVDLVTAPRLRESLLSALADAPTGLVVDLTRVSFLDSTGLAALAMVTRRADEQGVPVAVCCVQPVVQRVLDVTGLAELWNLHADRDGAVAAVTAPRD